MVAKNLLALMLRTFLNGDFRLYIFYVNDLDDLLVVHLLKSATISIGQDKPLLLIDRLYMATT